MENKFKFLTKYSLSKKLKNKWFIVANLIVMIIIVGLVNIDSIVSFFGGDFEDDTKIKIIDNSGYYSQIKSDLKSINNYFSDSKLIIKKVTKDLETVKKELKGTKDILLIINKDDANVFNVEFISDSYVDMTKYQSIVSSLNNTKKNIALELSGIDSNMLDKINSSISIKRSFLDQEKTEDEEVSKTFLSFASLIIALPCFMLIVFLVQMIGAEINEEKSTRGMEIIIGNVPAKIHFFSKVLSSNLFVIIQGLLLLLYGGLGIIIRKLTTSSNLSTVKNITSSLGVNDVLQVFKNSGVLNRLSYVIPLIIILLLLSFLAYSLLAGILASMTTNMENYQQFQTPLMVISVIGYYLILISSAFPGSLFIKVASVIPLISISLAPSLLLSGQIGVGVMIIGIVLLLLLDYILIKYGLKVYKVGILNYSESNLWKKIFHAVKEK